MTTKNFTGQRFGKLVVIKKLQEKSWGGYKYLCRCDCGNEKVIYGGDLNRTSRKGTTSCGCLNKKNVGESAFNHVFARLKKQATERNYGWNLTKEEVKILTSSPCFYCGTLPYQVQVNEFNGNYIYNGIDRVNNFKGYTVKNSVPCCGKCNRAKSDYSLDEFKNWAKSLFNHWASRSSDSHN